MEPRETVEAFYQAFARRDGAAMAALYAPEATFSDPVFRALDGAGAGAMWRMLVEGSPELRVEHELLSADGDTVRARWQAWYPFGPARRPVHNVIEATLVVRGGRIVSHVDRFDPWRWSRQALGPAGWLLGWTPLLLGRVRRTAAARLEKHRARESGGR